MEIANGSGPKYITEAELAHELGIPRNTLKQWRMRGQGPAFTRMERAIRYARVDVDAWCASHRVGGVS